MKLADQLATKLMGIDGVGVAETGPFAGRAMTPRKGGKKKASGYRPDWMGETIAMSQHGYSMADMRDPGVRAEKIFDGKGGSFMASVNKHETVETVKGPGGKKGTYVIPPKDSDAFRNLRASGFVPNFAGDVKYRRSGNSYDFRGTIGGLIEDIGAGSSQLKAIMSRYSDAGFRNIELSDKFKSSTDVKSYDARIALSLIHI